MAFQRRVLQPTEQGLIFGFDARRLAQFTDLSGLWTMCVCVWHTKIERHAMKTGAVYIPGGGLGSVVFVAAIMVHSDRKAKKFSTIFSIAEQSLSQLLI